VLALLVYAGGTWYGFLQEIWVAQGAYPQRQEMALMTVLTLTGDLLASHARPCDRV
jgi:hypothetical protein